MLEVLGESYYIDFTELESITNIPKSEKNTTKDREKIEMVIDDDTQHISIVKYETIKMMLEVILTEREEMDENLGFHNSKNLSLPFKIAFNTLLMYGIIKHL
jgi:hypothetical protein